jgi:hypothetical protein
MVHKPHEAGSRRELPMPRTRLKVSAKSVPAAKKTTQRPKTVDAEQTAPSLPKESDFTTGDTVSHPKFGSGVIKQIDGDKLTIEFSGKITKQIVDYYVKRDAR